MSERRVDAGGRPRPVADVPEAALAACAGPAAKAWLVALLERRPLAQAGRVPVAVLAERGPALCEAVLRALASDAALERLVAAPAAADIAQIAGAEGAADVVAAAEALRAALWAALADALPSGAGGAAADLSDRLAHACSVVTAESLAGARGAPSGRPDGPLDAEFDEPILAFGHATPGSRQRASPLWISALRRELADSSRSGRRLGLLLAELDDAERLRLSEREDVAAEAFDSAGRAVRRQVRRADVLAHEKDRFWLIAPDAGRAGSLALAQRVAAAVESAASLRGAPLTISVGVAIFPGDGIDAEALIDRAEEDMFATRAAGAPFGGDGGEDPAASPFGRGPRAVG